VQREQRRQAVPRAAQRDALQHAEEREQHDGGGAQRGVAGQEGHAGGGGAEQEQCRGQLRAASPARMHRHEQDGAQRARDEGEREDRERIQRALQPIHEREEHGGEDQRRGDAVHEEIEILRGASDDDADGDLARRDVGMGARAVVVRGCGGAGDGGHRRRLSAVGRGLSR